MSDLLNQTVIDYWESLIEYVEERGLPPVHHETYIVAPPEVYQELNRYLNKLTIDDLRAMYKQDEEQ